MVAVAVVFGARLIQLQPEDSLEASKAERAGMLTRFLSGPRP